MKNPIQFTYTYDISIQASLGFALSILVFSIIPTKLVYSAETLDKRSKPSHPQQAHWDYMGIEGPQHWGMLTLNIEFVRPVIANPRSILLCQNRDNIKSVLSFNITPHKCMNSTMATPFKCLIPRGVR